jgi:hypothetical protein
MKIDKVSFWCAALGAATPQIVRFFSLVSTGRPLPNLNWWQYVPLLIVYCFIAGMLSHVWKPERPHKALKAFWIGISMPSIVATLVQAAPSLPPLR